MNIKQILLVLSTITVSLEAALPCDPCSFLAQSDSITTASTPNALAFSSQNCLAVGVGSTVTVYRLDALCRVVGTGTVINLPASSLAIAFSPSGSCLLVANSNDSVTVYSVGPDCEVLNDGMPVSTVTVPGLQSIAVSTTGCVVATTDATGTPAPFTVYTGTLNADCSLVLAASQLIVQVGEPPVFSPDGSCVAFRSFVPVPAVLIYPVHDGCTLLGSDIPQSIFINSNSVAFGPSNCLAIAEFGGVVSIHAPTGPCRYNVNMPPLITNGITSTTPLIAFSSNNCLAVSNFFSGGGNSSVVIYGINSDCSLPNGGAPIHTIAVTSPGLLAYSSDGACLAIANSTGVLLYSTTLLTPVLTDVTLVGCDTITVSGTTSANVTVTIFVNNIPSASVTSDINGNFSTVLGRLTVGTYTITAQAQDPASGCISTSAAASVTVPAALGINSISTTCLGVSIVGTASANAPVTLFINGQARATITADANGTFAFFVPLTNGTYMFSITDIATGCSSATVTRAIVLSSCTTLTNTNTAFGGSCNNR